MKKNKNFSLFDFVNIIVTFFGVGNFKGCPGTWGSIATLPFWMFINFLMLITGITYSIFATLFIWTAITIGLFYLGEWASNIYMKQNGTCDPGEIVIDEVVGQLITFIMTTVSVVISFSIADTSFLECFNSSLNVVWFLFLLLVLPIILFRLFDISKPWIIGKLDRKCKGGFGVMIDDVIAGLFAGISSSLIIVLFF
jgi:phosphatidylglycerophosphatase A